MAQLELLLFGPPRLCLDGQQVDIRVHKAIALLAYLAVTKRPHSREALATLFWPDADQSTGLGRLRRTLYRVGQAAGPKVLRTTRTMAELDPQAELWLDTDRFRHLIAGCLSDARPDPALDEGCVDRLAAAAELYADDFMAGFTLPDSPPFDEWQFFEAEGLRRSFGRALQALAEAHQARGEWQPAIDYARRRLALDVLEEASHRRLMRLYALAGQQAAALRQYEECRRILDEELGVAPGKETAALHQAIKSRKAPALSGRQSGSTLAPGVDGADSGHDSGSLPARVEIRPDLPDRERPAEAPSPPSNLPAAVHPFVGREQELEEIQTLLADDPHCRLLVLTGTGGIGKTRLVLEAARRTLHIFGDGVYFVRLGPLPSVEHLLPALAEQVGLRLHGGTPARQQLLGYLSDKRLLLLLDNFEHLMAGAGLLAEILEAAPEVKILVTSRERLNLSGESVYALGGMPFPADDSCQDALDYGAVQLLIHLGRLARPHLELKADDVCQASRICRLVGGTPLALVLAASWLEMLSFREIADEIAENLDFLEGSLLDLPERQRSVRAAFEYSWSRLSDTERLALTRLSVFEDGFTREAARRVAGVQPHTLRLLIDKSLVSVDRPGRYEIHELLCQYAAQRLKAAGELGRMRDRHSEHYLSMAAQRETDLKGRRQIPALDEIEQDLANIRAAWHRAMEHEDEAALGRAAESLYLFFSFRARYREGAELFAAARERLAPCPDQAPSLGCSRLSARLAWLQLLSPPASNRILADLESHLEVARERDDRSEVAFSLLQLGCYHLLAAREPHAAAGLLEQSLEEYQALGDRFYTTVTLHWLGVSRGATRSLAELVRLMEQSLALARETGNRVLVPYNLRALAVGALGMGEYGAAGRYCHEALEIDAAVGASMGLAQSRILLGLIHLLEGDLDQALAQTERGLEMARRIGYAATTAYGLAVQSLVLSLKGRPALGQEAGDESLALASNSLAAILAHWGLAIAHSEFEEHDAAWKHVREGLQHADLVALSALKVWLLPVAAFLLDQRGQGERAVELLAVARQRPADIGGWTQLWTPLVELRARLRAELAADRYEAASKRGEGLEVDAAVTAILGDATGQS